MLLLVGRKKAKEAKAKSASGGSSEVSEDLSRLSYRPELSLFSEGKQLQDFYFIVVAESQ